ncbi:metallophosphoesterase family protein [Arenibacter echinorum]|nr:metallophosphoesterase [Arenibacter echinorum]
MFGILFLVIICAKGISQDTYNTIKIGMCSDVHLPTMHDSEYRISTFIDSMANAKPDFIIELGDFGTPAEKYASLFDIWNSFPGEKYHVIGNHEMDGGFSRNEALAYRDMKSGHYTFNKNNFTFIVLDGNDPKSEDDKGYKQFIGASQMQWLKDTLSKAIFPVVIFSHQGLVRLPNTEKEPYGLENDSEVREILEEHNANNSKNRIIACFNGHAHYDDAQEINDIWYITINSMAYKWMDEAYTQVRYSNEIDKEFKWIKFTAPYKEPLFTVVEISSEGYIKINGKKSEWVGPSPWELGYPESLRKYVKPEISKRDLRF